MEDQSPVNKQELRPERARKISYGEVALIAGILHPILGGGPLLIISVVLIYSFIKSMLREQKTEKKYALIGLGLFLATFVWEMAGGKTLLEYAINYFWGPLL